MIVAAILRSHQRQRTGRGSDPAAVFTSASSERHQNNVLQLCLSLPPLRQEPQRLRQSTVRVIPGRPRQVVIDPDRHALGLLIEAPSRLRVRGLDCDASLIHARVQKGTFRFEYDFNTSIR